MQTHSCSRALSGGFLRFHVMVLSLLVALLAAVPAWADETNVSVTPAQTVIGQEEANETSYLNLLYFQGARGETVYLNVSDGDTAVSKYLPYTLGEGQGDEAAGDDVSDVFAMSLEAIDEGKLRNGSYTIEAYDHRGGSQLYAGTVYGVWARIEDPANADEEGNPAVVEQLIGSRTVGEGGCASAVFTAPATVYRDGAAYTLQSGEPAYEGNLAYYYYVAAPADEGAVDATVSYVLRDEGTVVRTDTIASIPWGGVRDYAIPLIFSEGDSAYRTLAYTQAFTASNPGRASFVVPVVKLASRSPYHVAIRMQDADTGALLASDTLDVEGTYGYEAPSAIHRMEEVAGELRAVAYDLVDPANYTFDLVKDQQEVVNGVRTVVVNYRARALDAGEVNVTFNQLSAEGDTGSKRLLLGTQSATVTAKDATATPDQQITVNGTPYQLVGSPEDYAYAYGSGEFAVKDVYYAPKGYRATGPYTVTVSYVDIATRESIGGMSYQSTDNPAAQSFELPGSLQRGDVEYVRLDGQGEAIQHNFYSGIDTYTVYYRDAADENAGRTVITRTRVEYTPAQNPEGADGAQGEGNQNAAPAGQAGNDANAGNQNANAALNPATSYNAVTGDGDGTLLTQDGTDSNTERIDEDATPLAQLNGEGTQDQQQAQGGSALPVVLGVLLTLAVAAALAWWFLVARRRNDDKHGQHA